jgi:hypothetical protein
MAISLAAAAVLTLIAVLMTWGSSGPVGAKAVLAGAILVLPLVWAAKAEWPAFASIAFAFITYFAVCFVGVWFLKREKLATPRGEIQLHAGDSNHRP